MGNGLPYSVAAAVAYPGAADRLYERRRRLHERTGAAGPCDHAQAWNFAEALIRGDKDRWPILKDVLKQTVREVV